ncbi:MAG: hypothetical protein JSW08_02445 [archaeon]|nr:MAG: hypothetical protein JSW08_02445 [archaeon]
MKDETVVRSRNAKIGARQDALEEWFHGVLTTLEPRTTREFAPESALLSLERELGPIDHSTPHIPLGAKDHVSRRGYVLNFGPDIPEKVVVMDLSGGSYCVPIAVAVANKGKAESYRLSG